MRRVLLLLTLAGCLEPKPPPVDSGEETDPDGDGASAPADCDEGDPEVHPGATERCDERDEDCDGRVDEGALFTFFADNDGDGFGDPAHATEACLAPDGAVADATDCDDSLDTVFPGADERCEGIDNDCDDIVDENVRSLWYLDNDADGYGDENQPVESCDPPEGVVATPGDCDDREPASFPGNPEQCEGIDNDCDAQIDEGVTTTYWLDLDADGYGGPDFSIEACALPTGYAPTDDDCDDGDSAVSPGDPERCGGEDEDCDGAVDEASAIDAPTWYTDADQDGYGDPATATVQCAAPTGGVANALDCDDRSDAIAPNAPERCDGLDDDCDAQIDESGAIDAGTWYTDGDGDGYGDPGAPQTACAQPPGTVSDTSDCEDGDPLAFPGSHATETPLDGVDQDCDGLDLCTDLTCDAYPDLLLAGHYDGDYVSSAWIYPYNNGFSDSTRTTLPSYGPWETEVADFNNDGYLDIFLPTYHDGSSYTSSSYVYWGSAAGYSTSNRSALATVGASGTLARDLNGDGYIDLVVASYYNGTSYSTSSLIYWGSATGFSTGNRTSLSTTGARSVEAADFDADGYLDLAFCSYTNGSTFSLNSAVFWGSNAGYSTADRTDLATIGCFRVNVGDVNDDGYDDALFPAYYNGSSYISTTKVYYGGASGLSSAYSVSLPSQGATTAAVADLNADGYNEVVLSGYFASAWTSPIYTYLYTGSSLGISASVYTTVDIRGVLGLRIEDLNGDGYPELLAARHYDSASGYNPDSYVYWGSASGYSASSRSAMPGYGTYNLEVGDVDGDGYPEVVVPNFYSGAWPSTGSSYVYWGSASGYSSADRTALSATGVFGAPRLVGTTGW